MTKSEIWGRVVEEGMKKAEETVAFYKKVFSSMHKKDFKKVNQEEIVQMLNSIEQSFGLPEEKVS